MNEDKIAQCKADIAALQENLRKLTDGLAIREAEQELIGPGDRVKSELGESGLVVRRGWNLEVVILDDNYVFGAGSSVRIPYGGNYPKVTMAEFNKVFGCFTKV